MIQFSSYDVEIIFEADMVAEQKYRLARVAAVKAAMKADSGASAAGFNAAQAARRAKIAASK